MKKIEFYKKNELIEVDVNKIRFFPDKILLIKEESDYIIHLDFFRKKCTLALVNEKSTLEIPVIEMNFKNRENHWTLEYILETEPDIKNIIRIII